MKIYIALFLYLLITSAQAEERHHGFIEQSVKGKPQVWDITISEWRTPEIFWKSFAKSNKANFWGQADTYPNYNDTNEFDTVIIQLKEGDCLMQFFHSRWRRANDVQRWDDVFNDYSGCPFVFD